MPVVIAMLRGVNVGAHNRIKMGALRELCASLDLRDARTYVQSGNVVFNTKERNLPALAKRVQSGIENAFGFRSEVILRTAPEMRDTISRNPFKDMKDMEPGKLLVDFLATDPGPEARKNIQSMKISPEILHIEGREMYIYFPDGAGRSKLSWPRLEKILNTPGTTRNWNSVNKLLEIAEELENI